MTLHPDPSRSRVEPSDDLESAYPACQFCPGRGLMGLDEFWEIPARKLSTGQGVRANLVAAMLHAPKVLYLDEPTIGLDLMAKARIRDFILETNRSLGTTVFLTSHDMGDVSSLASRYLILTKGRKIFDGQANEFMYRFATVRELALRLPDYPERKKLVALLGTTEGCMSVVSVQDGLRCVLDTTKVAPLALLEKIQQIIRPDDVAIEPARLETAIMRVFSQQDATKGAQSNG